MVEELETVVMQAILDARYKGQKVLRLLTYLPAWSTRNWFSRMTTCLLLRFNAVPQQDVAEGLVRNVAPQVAQRPND